MAEKKLTAKQTAMKDIAEAVKDNIFTRNYIILEKKIVAIASAPTNIVRLADM